MTSKAVCSALGTLLVVMCACTGSDEPGQTPNDVLGGQGGSAGATAGMAIAGSAGMVAGTGAGVGPAAGEGGAGVAGASAGASAGTAAGEGGSAGTQVSPMPDAGTDAAGTDAAAGSDAQMPEPPSTGTFPPSTNYAMRGPYATTTLSNTGPNGVYTVYLPSELSPGGAKHPIVGWVSGGATNHTWYELLPHLASHGFVVVTANSIPGIGAEVALGQEVLAGIEWAIAENTRSGSTLEGKLDTSKIASSGYSMGSLATFTIAMDQRLTTTVHISGGNMVAERVNNLRAPAAFICGAPGSGSCGLLDANCDIAGVNCETDFQGASTPVFYGTFPSGHLGIMTSPFLERIAGMTTEWLRLHLMGDTTLRNKFIGPTCSYCSDPNWTVKQKNLQ